MACRRGMGTGTGSGYRNLIGKDPMVHSMSAKGMKQPQNVPYAAQVEMSPRGIGKAHTATVPKLKLEQISGDVNWKEYNGQFIVDRKFNNGEFDYYIIINFVNMKEAVGDEATSKYMVTVHVVAPSQASKKQIDSAFESMGFDPKKELKIRKDPKAVAGILDEYGQVAEVFTEEGDDAKELMDTAKKQVPAITGLFGFYMDKPVNRIGNSGWDAIKGDIGFKSEKMEHEDRLLIGHLNDYDIYEDIDGTLYHYYGTKKGDWDNPQFWKKLSIKREKVIGGLGDNRYRVIDNMNPERNVLVTANNKNDAMDKGAHELRTTNIRTIKLQEKIVGGLGDNRPDSDFDKKELAKGMKVEMEHTKDPAVAKEIVKDHLTEFPKGYYDGLDKLEKTLKQPKKVFYQRDRVGHAKYTISTSDGIKKHEDGSDFFDIAIFKNKKDLERYKQKLFRDGYVERG